MRNVFTRKRISFQINVSLLVFIGGVLLLGSCSSSKKINYFQDIPDSLRTTLSVQPMPYVEPVIQPNDILQVTIQTLDQSSNLSEPSGGGAGAANGASNYLVDKNGFIDVSLVGQVKIGGLTSSQARDYITQKASVYFKSPIVNVRFSNFVISVLGQVTKPGQYVILNEKASILDAISMAGDLTVFGKRHNVLLIRDVNNQKQFVRFDLRSSEVFKSPYFYLRQGDVIYVEPTRTLVSNTDATKNQRLTLLLSGLSLLVVLINTLRK